MLGKKISYQEGIQEYKNSLYRIINNYSEEPVSYEGCNTLIVFTVSGFLGKNKDEDFHWWGFLSLRREAPVSTRSKTAARYADMYFIPWSQYKTGKLESDYFRRIVFVYISFRTKDDEHERLWLKNKAEEGCLIIADQPICFSGADGVERYEKNSFYLPVMLAMERIMDIDFDRFYDLLEFQNTYMQLQFYGNLGLQRSDYIIAKLNDLFGYAEPVIQFYNIIKICEYCIHMRALKSLCQSETWSEQNSEKLIHPSLGIMNSLQKTDEVIEDPSIAESARQLDMMLSGKGFSAIKQSRVSYLKLCEIIVRLRNRYLGHGIMSEKVSFDLLKPLTVIMKQIVNNFVNSARLEEDDCLISPFNGDSVPAIKVYKNETYCFCGYYCENDIWYADYLCFKLGLSLRFQLNEMEKAVLISEKTASEALQYSLPELSAVKPHSLDRNESKYIGKTAEKFKYFSLVYDEIGEDTDNSIWGTQNYSEFVVNLKNLYINETFRKLSLNELHHVYLKTTHPASILQMDQTYLRELEWTDEIFSKASLLNMIRLGLFLPQCNCLMALIDTDPERIYNPYPWIRNTEVVGFRNKKEFENWKASVSGSMMLEKITALFAQVIESLPEKQKAKYTLQYDFLYRKQSILYERLLNEFQCASILQNYHNVYFAGMMKNAMDAPNPEFSFIALFDFLEFAMLAIVYWESVQAPIRIHSPNALCNIATAGQIIAEISEKYEIVRFKDLVKMRLPVSGKLRNLHQRCTRYIPVKFEGDQIDFLTACEILRYLRNRTKGHGFIQKFNASDLWELTMYYAMAVVKFLGLDAFCMELDEDSLWVKYQEDETELPLDRYYMYDGNMPCPLIDTKGDTEIFQNYFTGERFQRKNNDSEQLVES